MEKDRGARAFPSLAHSSNCRRPGESPRSRAKPRTRRVTQTADKSVPGNKRAACYDEVVANHRERWLVAAWPGMGQVATTAAIYLLSKLKMHQVGEFTARELFELESVEVQGGLLHAARLPRSRLFLASNAEAERDIVVFL